MKNCRPFLAFLLIIITSDIAAQYKMEYLTRGVHAVSDGSGKIFVSWRLLGTEDTSMAFNLYRTTDKKTVQLNKSPILTATNFTDVSADSNKLNVYTVKAIINKKEEKTGSYASLEELVSANLISTDMLEATGYKFEIRLVPDGFEISAVPVEYGKTGKLSFFMNNETAMIRGADHGGGPASASDPHIGY